MNDLANAIIQAANMLGNNNASTHMGALEAHGLCVKESGELCAEALMSCSSAFEDIAFQLSRIADAMKERNALGVKDD
jgi:hypothetical protein